MQAKKDLSLHPNAWPVFSCVLHESRVIVVAIALVRIDDESHRVGNEKSRGWFISRLCRRVSVASNSAAWDGNRRDVAIRTSSHAGRTVGDLRGPTLLQGTFRCPSDGAANNVGDVEGGSIGACCSAY